MEKYIRYETPGNVSIISEQKKHPATCKIYSQNQHYKHTRKVVNTRPEKCFRYHQNRHFIKLKQIPLFAQKRLFPMGILFIFEAFQAAGRDPSTSFLFIITNYEFRFLLLSIHSAQQFLQKYQSFLITTTSLLSTQSNHLTLPYPGHTFP